MPTTTTRAVAGGVPDRPRAPIRTRTVEADRRRKPASTRCTRGLVKLDDRSRDIIQRRWLSDDDKATLQELADEYGVSAERIRQVEANAMKKMRALFA